MAIKTTHVKTPRGVVLLVADHERCVNAARKLKSAAWLSMLEPAVPWDPDAEVEK